MKIETLKKAKKIKREKRQLKTSKKIKEAIFKIASEIDGLYSEIGYSSSIEKEIKKILN